MTSPKCILCPVEITDENDSREHVIANAIGGRKRVRGLLCKACNQTTGDSWDVELARQLQPLSSFFGIKRQRGALPSQIVTAVSGNQYARRPNGQLTLAGPVYEEIKTDSESRILIRARTPKEARQLLNRAKATYPQLNVDALTAQV
jgi:hypothetical protein